MNPLLRGPKLKVARAREHIKEMIQIANSFRLNTKLSITIEKQDNQDRLIAKIQEPIPEKIDILVGEALFHLRSSLDRLICATVLRDDPNAELGGYDFPTGSDVNDKNMLKKIKMIPADEVKKLVEELKPYKDGNPRLWAMSKLNNIDKHRTFIAIGSISQESVEISNAVINGPAIIPKSKSVNLSEGSEVLRAPRIAFPHPHKPEDNVKLLLNIAFTDLPEVSEVSDKAASQVLTEMADMVDNIISKFEVAYFS